MSPTEMFAAAVVHAESDPFPVSSKESIVLLDDDALVEDPETDGDDEHSRPTMRMPRAEQAVLVQISTPASAWTPTEIVKVCSCGAAHDRRAWELCAYVGTQDGGHGSVLELRNCGGCLSTMAIEVVPPLEDWRTLPKTTPAPAQHIEKAR